MRKSRSYLKPGETPPETFEGQATPEVLYLQAELENLRKRADREVRESAGRAKESLVANLLPILDDFDRALATLDGESAKGMQMVYAGVLEALRKEGLEPIPALGETFDPHRHEVVGSTADDQLEEGKVSGVLQKGYTFQKRLMRPAKVYVVKKGG